jgi:hypothetical protein
MKPDTLDIPEPLIQSILEHRAVLFVGAGISRGQIQTDSGSIEQHLPTWSELLILLLNRTQVAGYLTLEEFAELKQAVSDRKYLFVAEAVRRKIGALEFNETLDDLFRNPNLRPTQRHKLITEIPFSAIVTTNYDKLLESAYTQQRHNIPPTYTFQDASDIMSALAHRRFFILKAHGDIDRKDSVILSERDYRDIIYRQPGYRAVLNALFITKTILFVGASLNDVDVKLVLESVSETFSGKGPGHFALLPEQEAGDAEVMYWKDFFGIRLLRYTASEGHPEVDAFLERLKESVATKT